MQIDGCGKVRRGIWGGRWWVWWERDGNGDVAVPDGGGGSKFIRGRRVSLQVKTWVVIETSNSQFRKI